MDNNPFSLKISIFHRYKTPEEGTLVGYGALMEAFALHIPLPSRLTLISTKKRKYKTDLWQVLTSRHEPVNFQY